MRYAVIMAGGAGVRLWPLSRRTRPKQLMRIFHGTSLLRLSFERVAAVLPPKQVYIITNEIHLPAVAKECPEIPVENLIGEPVGRDTANAIGTAMAILAEEDPQAVAGIFTADHLITPVDRFVSAVDQAYQAAEDHPDALVTIGVRPLRPDTSFGYLHRGERLGEGLYTVREFAEKPNMAEAMKYQASGEYFWNSGMFTWRVATILEQIKKHLPQSYDSFLELGRAWHTGDRQLKMQAIYPRLLKISIDFAVMEHADKVLTVAMDSQWIDVGSWPALEAVIEADADQNVSACKNVLHLGSRGNIVVSEDDHLIATIGVDDLVIVHAPDATLICTKRDALGMKELVDNIGKQFGETYR